MTVGMVDCALCAVSKKAAEQAAQELAAAKAESTRLAALVKQHEQTIAQLEIARKHGAEVSLEDAHPGQQPPGALFSVRFAAREEATSPAP